MNKKLMVILALAAVAAVVAYLLSVREGADSTDGSRTASAPDAAVREDVPSTAPVQGAAVREDEGNAAKKPRENGWAAALGTNRLAAAEAALKRQEPEREMTEEEEKLVEFAKDIAGAQDAAAARRFAGEQLNAAHPKVREAAVYALANCGEPCLAELTPFMADADEGVRIEAVSAWRSEWFAMPNGNPKAEAAVAVMCVLNDEQALDPIAAELLKFKRETALEALGVVLEQGTKAGRKVAARAYDALGDK